MYVSICVIHFVCYLEDTIWVNCPYWNFKNVQIYLGLDYVLLISTLVYLIVSVSDYENVLTKCNNKLIGRIFMLCVVMLNLVSSIKHSFLYIYGIKLTQTHALMGHILTYSSNSFPINYGILTLSVLGPSLCVRICRRQILTYKDGLLCVFMRQNLTSVDVRFWRIKTVPAPKELKYF